MHQKKKILFVSQGIDGGIAAICSSLSKQLSDFNWEIHIAFIGKSVQGEIFRDFCNYNITYSTIDLGSGNGFRTIYNNLAGVFQITSLARKFTPDIIMIGGVMPALFLTPSLWFCVTKNIILWEHGPQNSYLFVKKILLRLSSIFIDYFVSVTQSSYNDFVTKFRPFRKKKYTIIENGVDVNSFFCKRDDLLTTPKLRIIMPSRLDLIQKDHMLLIEACSRLIARNIPVSLTLAGAGPHKEKIQSYILQEKLEEHVHLVGHVNNLKDELVKHDVLCLATKWEGFGLVLVEGMLAGLLATGSRVTGVINVINEQNGVLFNPGSAASIENTLEQIYNNKNYYIQLASAGQQNAIERFSMNRMGKEMDSFLNSYLNGSK